MNPIEQAVEALRMLLEETWRMEGAWPPMSRRKSSVGSGTLAAVATAFAALEAVGVVECQVDIPDTGMRRYQSVNVWPHEPEPSALLLLLPENKP